MAMNNNKKHIFNSLGFGAQKGKLGDELHAIYSLLSTVNSNLTTLTGNVGLMSDKVDGHDELLKMTIEKKTVENTDGTETLPDSLSQPVQKFIFYGASDKDDGVVIGAEDPTATLTDGEDETDSPATHTITASGYTLHKCGAFKDSLEVSADGTGKLMKYVYDITLASLNWDYDGGNNFFLTTKPWTGPNFLMCDGYVLGEGDDKRIDIDGAKNIIVIKDSDYSTVEAFVEALSTKKLYYATGEAQTTNLTKAQVNAILNGAKTFKGSTDVEASNDNSLTQAFTITYVKNLMES